MHPVRFALAGFGAWGKFHAQSIAGHPDARLVAISAPTEATRAEARQLYPDAQIFADSLEMVAQAEFDLFDIATPSHTHRLFEAIGHPDKEMQEMPGANHDYSGPDQKQALANAVDVITDWLARHGFAGIS